jgi:carbohydrate kinase (thermoresistant glucokinase family)
MVNAIVVMGVSGCGKTTVARLLARRLGWAFAEADELHSPANVAKMRAGIPLNDDDRGPWLAAIAGRIDSARDANEPIVVTCSALKRRYRDILVGSRPDVALVYLKGDYDTIAQRMAARPHHYMPVSLLKSQFGALEEPAADERAIVLDIRHAPEELVDQLELDPCFRRDDRAK